MTIIRKARTSSPFTTVLNSVVEDKDLNAEALGVLVYLVGKPDGWRVMPTQLKNRFGCGRDRIYRIISDLIEAGYMQREQGRSDDGSFEGGNYLVSDEKMRLTENKEAEVSDLPLTENKTLEKKQSKKETLNSHSAKPKKLGVNDKIEYSEEFENSVWKPYPRGDGSKKKAYDFWNMLNDENRARVIAAIPLFAAQMKREGRPADKIPHLTTWFNDRRYENVPAGASVNGPSASEVPFWKRATREQWQKVLDRWQQTEQWSESWGGHPDQSYCSVPADMLAAHNLKFRAHRFRQADLDGFEKLVASQSKHTVDTGPRA